MCGLLVMAITMVQDTVRLIGPCGTVTFLWPKASKIVTVSHRGESDRLTSIEEAHELFDSLFDQGWR